jgi:hypothetical protein
VGFAQEFPQEGVVRDDVVMEDSGRLDDPSGPLWLNLIQLAFVKFDVAGIIPAS